MILNPEDLLSTLLTRHAADVPPASLIDINEYIQHGECGLAYDLLVFHIQHSELGISEYGLVMMHKIAESLGVTYPALSTSYSKPVR